MTERDLTNTNIVWEPLKFGGKRAGKMMITPHPRGATAESRELSMSIGACMAVYRDAEFDKRKRMLAFDIVTILVRGEVMPDALHRALLPLLEYRDMLPMDAIGDSDWRSVEGLRRSYFAGVEAGRRSAG